MRTLLVITALVGISAPVPATTLEQLPLPEMARQSTAIVRGRVLGVSGMRRGPDVYTVYRLSVAEVWKREGLSSPDKADPDKAKPDKTLEVAVPGGVAGGLRQMVAGAPRLEPGGDYLLFLWTGRSGITQVTGLSQGLFGIGRNPQGEWIASRNPATETMLDAAGRIVHDQAVTMTLSELRARVERALLQTPREAK
jgi:hypothetical protein